MCRLTLKKTRLPCRFSLAEAANSPTASRSLQRKRKSASSSDMRTPLWIFSAMDARDIIVMRDPCQPFFLLFGLSLSPTGDEAVFNAQYIEDLPHNETHQIINGIRLVIKSGHGRD